MLVAIDIGNTTTSFAFFKEEKIVRTFKVETNLPVSVMRAKIKRHLSFLRKDAHFRGAIICSVVPRALRVIKPLVRNTVKKRPLVVGEDIKIPIKNKYRNPKQVGKDRLVGAFAAKELYGTPAIIIDFGTAITFDVISKSGAYKGGIIVPGIRLSAKSLSKNTALLPLINIKAAKNLVGKSTQESILSGLFFGYGALIDGIVKRLKKETKENPKVIMTGGYANLIKKYIHVKIDKIDQDLVFRGMNLLFK